RKGSHSTVFKKLERSFNFTRPLHLWKDFPTKTRFLHQAKASCRPAFRQYPADLFPDTFATDLMNPRRHSHNSLPGPRLDLVSKASPQPNSTQTCQRMLRET